MARQDKKYFFESTADNSRLRANDEPVEQTFRDLTDSVPFFTDEGSEATTSGNGIVRYATQNEIDTETGEGVVKSKETPQTDVTNIPSSIVPPILYLSKIKNGIRNVFRVGITTAFVDWLTSVTVPYTEGTNGQVLTKGDGVNFSWQTPQTGFNPNGTANQVIRGNGTYADRYENVGLIGGSTGQVLAKLSSTNGDYEWVTIDPTITGGNTGQVLTKNSSVDGDYDWKDGTNYTFANSGTGQSVYDETATSGNDIKFRSVLKDPSSTFPFVIATSGRNIAVKIDKVDPNDGLTLDENQVNWGAMGAPTDNTFYGWIQHLVDNINP